MEYIFKISEKSLSEFPANIERHQTFLTLLETEQSRIRVPADLVSSEVCFLIHRGSCYSGRGKGILWSFFRKDSNPIQEGSKPMI